MANHVRSPVSVSIPEALTVDGVTLYKIHVSHPSLSKTIFHVCGVNLVWPHFPGSRGWSLLCGWEEVLPVPGDARSPCGGGGGQVIFKLCLYFCRFSTFETHFPALYCLPRSWLGAKSRLSSWKGEENWRRTCRLAMLASPSWWSSSSGGSVAAKAFPCAGSLSFLGAKPFPSPRRLPWPWTGQLPTPSEHWPKSKDMKWNISAVGWIWYLIYIWNWRYMFYMFDNIYLIKYICVDIFERCSTTSTLWLPPCQSSVGRSLLSQGFLFNIMIMTVITTMIMGTWECWRRWQW